ncbi:MAG: NAD-dependent epimerase/dehydratase family protein [Cyanobacteria bacterium]|nr:NAD-dependent epimerase/dehydratase family protein [Cyanobacteriota bacterium]
MNGFWSGRRILVTGGAGFVGRAVAAALARRGLRAADIVIPRSRNCDLRIASNCEQAVRGCSIVIHLAAPTGNVVFSRSRPASQFRDCTLINTHLFEAARLAAVERVVSVGNLLAYPARAVAPFDEAQVRDGHVDDGYLGIALAKRQLIDLADLYHREYALDAATVLGANAYGPHDHFHGAQAHVIPATIAKCFRDEDLVVWGDGSATRDFLFVDDLAEGIVRAAERLTGPAVVNISSGTEVSVAELVATIARLCGFTRRITFDRSKPGGGPRRVASSRRAREWLDFSPHVSLEDGLRATIEWFRQSLPSSAAP